MVHETSEADRARAKVETVATALAHLGYSGPRILGWFDDPSSQMRWTLRALGELTVRRLIARALVCASRAPQGRSGEVAVREPFSRHLAR